jgi:hypothetical protein
MLPGTETGLEGLWVLYGRLQMIRDAAPGLAEKLAARLERGGEGGASTGASTSRTAGPTASHDRTRPGKGVMEGWAWWGVQHSAAAVLALALRRRFLNGGGDLSARL